MNPTKEQEHWFWEQCGLNTLYPSGEFPIWIDSTNMVVPTSGAKSPPIDPNNLLRYAVPELRKRGILINLSLRETTIAKVYSEFELHKVISFRADKDPAIALFWAIYKVLGGGVDG